MKRKRKIQTSFCKKNKINNDNMTGKSNWLLPQKKNQFFAILNYKYLTQKYDFFTL